MTTVYLYTGPEEAPHSVGLAYINQRKGRLASTLAYSHEYLADPGSYAIDPEFPLQAGNWPASQELPGSLMDSTPDRWGRNLINKRYPGRRLTNLDYLLGVSDVTRQGALRLRTDPDGAFEYPDAKVPKLIALADLFEATQMLESASSGVDAVKFLLEAGSGSLGGARPKAAVMKDGCLYMAKFPHKSDQEDVISAEYQALQGAEKQGILVPEHELVRINNANILLVRRFDRLSVEHNYERVPYISAMTALGAKDGEQRDYLEIIDFISLYGSHPKQDIAELLRRIRYTIEINNTDDHLRNHGFLFEKGGWRLSPVFDINPNPHAGEPRQTALGGFTDAAESLKVLKRLEQQQGV